MPERDYDATLARIAGNIAAGMVTAEHGGRALTRDDARQMAAAACVIAQEIVASARQIARMEARADA